MNNSIHIFQKNWAFTSSDSENPKIKTGSFGPCYVVTFTGGKFAAMAHIDDNTNVDSITAIFNKFKENSINLEEVNVIVLGGWKKHPESFKWGVKILKKLNEYTFKNISEKNMYKKENVTDPVQTENISMSYIKKYYHLGALVDSLSGKTFILNEYSLELEKQQVQQTRKFAEKYSSALDTELPLTQVVK